MPKILSSAVKQIMAKGFSKARAEAIAISTLEKSGSMNKKGQLTAKGKKRNVMTRAQRAKTRKA